MKAAAFLALVLPLGAADRVIFNDGWRFERFGMLADGSHRPEPGTRPDAVRATSEEVGKGNVATNAIDGNPSTRWCAAGGGADESVTVDLGRALRLGSVEVMPEQAELECAVEVSADGVAWRPLQGGGAGERQRFSAGEDEVRWVRVLATNVTPRRWASVREIEMRDPQGARIEPESAAAGEGPQEVAFDDSSWRPLSLPHDWGIEGPFRLELDGSTGKLPWVGIGWYRKTFTLPDDAAEKRYFIDIDGAMSDSAVYLNGERIGRWPYGYSSYRMELTGAIRPGAGNVLAIRLDNKDQSSRWYPGAGLYRNVWLVEEPAVSNLVRHRGLRVRTRIEGSKAVVSAGLEFEEGDGPEGAEIHFEVVDADGRTVASASGGSPEADLELARPELWSPESPYRYSLRARVVSGGREQRCSARFGIRTIEFDAEKGFLLNGERTDLKGVCMHHDLGPLGTAFHVEAAERQIRILREMGCNSIRTSHNPPAPEFVELCDRMGMLLQVEAFDTWDRAKRSNDYARFFPEWHERDLRLMVRNFRNHPSVIMWSIGNEIPGGYQTSENGWKMADKLRRIVREEDPTRPVTMGNNSPGAAEHLWKGIDLLGFNYKPHLYETFHAKGTGVPVYGSETASCISSRGEYFFPVSMDKSKGRANFQMSSYDTSAPPWAQRPDVEFTAQDRTQPWNFGEYVWTGFDYLGEPTPYNSDITNLLNIQDPAARERLKAQLDELGKVTPPSRSSYFGIVDLCGFPKDRYFLYQSRWRPELPMAHILPHWNWPERRGEVTPVHVYTSGDEAELFLNGRSLGRKRMGAGDHRLVWDEVKYEPGELRVVAYRDGREWATADRSTTGEAAKLVAASNSIGELSFVEVTVVDDAGREVPRSHPALAFEPGEGVEILAAGNGDATSHATMWRAREMPAYNGKCLAIVRGRGSLGVTAEGLDGVTVRVGGDPP